MLKKGWWRSSRKSSETRKRVENWIDITLCKVFHKKDHFCWDDECAPVLPGNRCHFCNRCNRTWTTGNPRVFPHWRDTEANYQEDKPGDFQSDGTYIEEDENGVSVTRSQPFDRREKCQSPPVTKAAKDEPSINQTT